ncbi:2'-5' RNA ligase family protein [Spirillospora sp. NPDC047279]|uniref:2'-5' RNA ligase family protein n=1 Tax=Spirillospora sp. NPDC047279 TaxID=3155478 RepID=UPI0033ED9640
MSPYPVRMSNHWWWRPGVRPGRRLLVWHILLRDQPHARELVRHCQDRLADVPGLDLVPADWLHMTTQIVGFADEIGKTEVDAMLDAATGRLTDLVPIEVELGKPWFHSEAVMLGIRPPRALDPIRVAIREAVAESVRVHQLDDEPEWTPHVSVAYSHAEGPAAPVLDAFAPPPAPRELRVEEVHLVEQVRVGRLYRWEDHVAVPLGA